MNPSGRFDPFNDRLSRDLRNSLSEVFADALTRGDDRQLDACARNWLQRNISPELEMYLAERLKRYRAVFDALGPEALQDDVAVAAAIWNRALFFEVHEFLERIWRTESGEEREALKGLIQAAGVYVHREHHNLASARRLAGRALGRLSGRSRRLARIKNLDALCRRLENLKNPPPRLLLRPCN